MTKASSFEIGPAAILTLEMTFYSMRLFPYAISVSALRDDDVSISSWWVSADRDPDWKRAFERLPAHYSQHLAMHGRLPHEVALAVARAVDGATVYSTSPEDAMMAMWSLYATCEEPPPFTIEPLEALLTAAARTGRATVTHPDAVAAAHRVFHLSHRAEFEARIHTATVRILAGFETAD